jgi:predicted phage terminase large subunit-like protein
VCEQCLSKADQDEAKRAVETEVVAAKRELARREMIRRRMVNFALRFIPGYTAGWVHKLICAKLERFVQEVERRASPRMMFFQPPRTGKSSLVSRCFPAWVLGHHPEWEFISASYSSSLPMGFSRWIKSTMGTAEYQALFPQTRLDPNASATDGWYTTKGGMYLPVGVGGAATGKGAHIMNIDDPVKDAEAADSETILQGTWDWWDSVADTRISPGGGALVTMTRWSDLDLAGRLISQETDLVKDLEEQIAPLRETIDDQTVSQAQRDYAVARVNDLRLELDEMLRWDVVNFPALAEHDEYITEDGHLVDTPPEQDSPPEPVRRKGEALHPERYDAVYYRRKRKTMQKRFWNALYQQKPVPDDGDIFKRENFRFEPHTYPHFGMPVYAAWDLAIGQKARNDWTVGLFGVLDYNANLHLINRIRVRTDELAELIFASSIPYADTLQLTGIEQGQIQMSIMPGLRSLLESKRAKEHHLSMAFDEELKPVTDKVARARPAQAWTQQGRIILPNDQPWTEDFIAELLRFPNGVNDDQVDGLSWLVRMVAKQSPPTRAKVKSKHKSWKDKLKDAGHARGHMAA